MFPGLKPGEDECCKIGWRWHDPGFSPKTDGPRLHSWAWTDSQTRGASNPEKRPRTQKSGTFSAAGSRCGSEAGGSLATTVGRTLKTDNPCNALKKPECVDICIVQSSFLFRCGIQEGRRTDVIEEIQVDCGLILFPLLYDYKSTNFWRPRHKSFRIGSPPIHSHCDAKWQKALRKRNWCWAEWKSQRGQVKITKRPSENHKEDEWKSQRGRVKITKRTSENHK